MKRTLCLTFILALLLSLAVLPASAKKTMDTVTLNVYNWGQYISDGSDDLPDTNELFEEYFNTYLAESYGYYIEVNYSTYPSNEDMYNKLVSGSASFDVVVPSDYMIERMIAEDLLIPLDFDKIPNLSNIDEKFFTEYTFVCEDVSVLPSAEVSADAPYTVSVDLGGNATTAELTLKDDGNANLKVFTDIPCTYEKIGSAVVLTPAGELEGYAAQIWMVVKHAYILNEDHSMTAIVNAYNAGQLALLCLDETNMKVEFPAYGMSRDGFTYTLTDNTLTVTAPDAETMGAFAQIWSGVGGENWTVDGNTATKVE